MKIMASNNLDGSGGWGLFELKNTEERGGGSSASFGNPGVIRDKNIVSSIGGGGGGMERKGCRFFWNNLSNQPRLLANVTHLFTTTYWIIHHKLTHGCTKKNRLKNTVLKGKAHNKTYGLCSRTFFSFFFNFHNSPSFYFITSSRFQNKNTNMTSGCWVEL